MLQQFNRHSRMPLLSEYEQQDEPVSLQELLGRFKEYEFVPGLFAQTLALLPVKSQRRSKQFQTRSSTQTNPGQKQQSSASG